MNYTAGATTEVSNSRVNPLDDIGPEGAMHVQPQMVEACD
jgi:hypothetical protein